jgi:hypothetical protein
VWVSASRFSLALVVLALAGCDGTRGVVLGIPSAGRPKLLYTPNEEPTGIAGLTYLRDHIAEVEALPFDGITVDVGLGDAPWGSVAYARADFDAEVEMLQSITFGKLTDNFQMFNARTGGIDWFDDAAFAVVLGNARVAAEVVRDAGLKGLFFDVEQVDDPVWSYPTPPDVDTFPRYEAEAHRRGVQLMAALIEVKPDITILATVSTSEVFRSVCIENVPFVEERYRLLPAFLDGMAEAKAAAGAPALIVDGFVGSYGARDVRSFPLYRELIQGNWPGVIDKWFPGITSYRFGRLALPWPTEPALMCAPEVRAKLTRDMPAGFGVLLDVEAFDGMDFHLAPAEHDMNYFPPGALEVALSAALHSAERYVFLWSTTMDWIGVSSQPRPPREYVDCVARARATLSP